jgi:hypothetical protein
MIPRRYPHHASFCTRHVHRLRGIREVVDYAVHFRLRISNCGTVTFDLEALARTHSPLPMYLLSTHRLCWHMTAGFCTSSCIDIPISLHNMSRPTEPISLASTAYSFAWPTDGKKAFLASFWLGFRILFPCLLSSLFVYMGKLIATLCGRQQSFCHFHSFSLDFHVLIFHRFPHCMDGFTLGFCFHGFVFISRLLT